jgi:hypothetical protein
MIRTCPSCGYRTADDQTQYCNKCGYPLQDAAPAPQATRAAPARAIRTPPASPARPEPRPPRQKKGGGTMPFGNLIARKYLKAIYFLGAIAIVVIALLGISAGFSSTGSGAAIKAFTNTTALVATPTASPLFWIGVLVFGSLVWRIFCELVAMVFWMYNAITEEEGAAPADTYGEDAAGPGPEGWEEDVPCPRCGKIVPASELRECEHCGVQGCSSCIRMMGLLKKTMTCKDCFENK